MTPHTIGVLITAAALAALLITRHTPTAHRRDQARILTALHDRPGPHTGLGLAAATRMHTGRVYPALTRLEQTGHVTSDWQTDPANPYRRRVYQLRTDTEETPVICPPCATAADNNTPHGKDDCEDNGKKYRGCACQHRATTPGPDQQQEPDGDRPT